jgi:hypothetical protein
MTSSSVISGIELLMLDKISKSIDVLIDSGADMRSVNAVVPVPDMSARDERRWSRSNVGRPAREPQ